MVEREAAYPFLSLPKERNLFFQPASISPQPRMLAVLLQNIRQTEAGRERRENIHTPFIERGPFPTHWEYVEKACILVPQTGWPVPFLPSL